MEIKTQNNINKEKVNEQLKELAYVHTVKEINDSLIFSMLSSLAVCVSMLNPEILTVLEERFKACIKVLKTTDNALNINKNQTLKQLLNISETIDSCAAPYFAILDSIKQALKEANNENK